MLPDEMLLLMAFQQLQQYAKVCKEVVSTEICMHAEATQAMKIILNCTHAQSWKLLTSSKSAMLCYMSSAKVSMGCQLQLS